MKNIYIQHISGLLNVQPWQVENCVTLFEDGCTVPFISRYRKEKTGGLSDVEVTAVKHHMEEYEDMEKRKTLVLSAIEAAGNLDAELKRRIENLVDARELEDIYLPYKPKRKTRASVAIAAGLEPLADAIMSLKCGNAEVEAKKYINNEIANVEAALSGARDIIAERISDNADFRKTLREIFRSRRIVSKLSKKGKDAPEASKFKSYFDFSMPISRIPSHNLLAILRGADEGYLNISIDADAEKCCNKLSYEFYKGKRFPSQSTGDQIKIAIADSYKRLLEPSISNEVINEAKVKADEESIEVFGENLKQLLLSSPAGTKRTMAIDPGFRTGCKVVCLDENGGLLHYETIFPHPPMSKKIESICTISSLVEKYKVELIAIGNGTAGRETEDFIKRVGLDESIRVYSVSEDGASVYSASEIAREEFPDKDVTVRGAVSIGRRLMDPLSELVKIDPKSLGVGQYQHDVDQKMLKEKLDSIVEYCVNAVGVNLNTASPYLLRYVSGIGPNLADKIVEYRAASGGFRNLRELLKVPRFGQKAFEQSAGFLRITGGENPLDASAVHPESYHIVSKMAADLGLSEAQLVGNEEAAKRIEANKYVNENVGLPTVNDIIRELAKPGLDPRQAAEDFSFSDEVHEIGDLIKGMELPGIVRNLTAFGAFVDIGVHQDGLIHASKMGVKGMATPSKVLKLGEKVKVEVIDVDIERQRISLRLIK